jgi:serine/threonine-protein kinase RsbW
MEEKSVNTLLMPDIFFFLAGRNDRSIRLLENNSHGTNIDNDDLLIVLKGCIKDIRTEFLANIIMRNKSISYPMIKSISSAFRINKINASPILILDYTLHRSYEFPIKSSLKAINLAVNMIRNKVVQYNSDKIWKIETVLQEALVNAVTYGNGLNSARPLQMNYEIGEKGLRVFIKDSGKGFDVFNTSVPIGREALEKISGRGIYIMKKFSDAIFYNRQGNEVIMFFSFV